MAKSEQNNNIENTMQLAEILSDLVSLRVCHPTAALALVSARSSDSPTPSSGTTALRTANQTEGDEELRRAKELVRLHYEVREAQRRGELGRGLEEAREAVRGVGG
ncbi:hypothetical protein B0J11DRAFT_530502 [Dendryphion nanum]|uniref:Uncharacterized protein n=1 Tax=Dendryphion nanum TaxID=256645 RepID=A0A9P9IKP5_9PLEO|nr:hypothetical protein B0J11DRAFT_530502 [Dendryphion nanum]